MEDPSLPVIEDSSMEEIQINDQDDDKEMDQTDKSEKREPDCCDVWSVLFLCSPDNPRYFPEWSNFHTRIVNSHLK